jgi:uncharacterized protein YbjT (DUF2867 family)
MERTAILIGASGLIGLELLRLLLEDTFYAKVTILVRRDLHLTHPKFEQQIINFDDLSSGNINFTADDAFCTLGTTMKKAGSREAFRKVDELYVEEFARLALFKGAQRFFLVSSMGANPGSIIFYSKVKGQVEQKVSGLPFRSVHIFRPSMLMGKRSETRPGEEIAIKVYSWINPLLPDKYKGIDGKRVAEAMLAVAKGNSIGINIHQSDKIQQLSR